MDREVEALAKETMLAVDRAEQQAQETVWHAQEEAQRLRQDAAAKGQQLIEAAEKKRKSGRASSTGWQRQTAKSERQPSSGNAKRNRNSCGPWPAPGKGRWPGPRNGSCWAIPEGGERLWLWCP